MAESAQLRSAREHLSRAEAGYRSEDGLFHLEEGLDLLDEVIGAADAEAQQVARNLLATYAAKIYGNVERLVASDLGLPEPELEHFFRLIRAFDQRGFELPADARATKIGLVKRLIDRYLEGYPPEQKKAALAQLAAISGEGQGAPIGEAQTPATRPRPRRPRKA